MGLIEDQLGDDRWTAVKVMKAMGKRFHEMVSPLIDLGLLACHKDHRKRANLSGPEICHTCENTLIQEWKRNLYRLSEDEVTLLDAKWAWQKAHEDIERTCIERAIQDIEIHTTRSETIDGKEVKILTVRKETRINVALLHLRAEIQDKLARFAGYDVKRTGGKGRERPRPVVVHELNANGEREPERTN